jgi:hypothetical protein
MAILTLAAAALEKRCFNPLLLEESEGHDGGPWGRCRL